MSTDEWMDKEDVPSYLSLSLWERERERYDGTLLSHKKKLNNTICSKKDGPRDYHTKWSKSERQRRIPYDNTYMKSKKMNLFTKQKQTHRHRKQTYGYQRGKGGREKLGAWD